MPFVFMFFSLLLITGLLLYLLFRNELVWRYHLRVLWDPKKTIDEQLENIKKLPSYDAMMWSLFRFNWDKKVGYTPSPWSEAKKARAARGRPPL